MLRYIIIFLLFSTNANAFITGFQSNIDGTINYTNTKYDNDNNKRNNSEKLLTDLQIKYSKSNYYRNGFSLNYGINLHSYNNFSTSNPDYAANLYLKTSNLFGSIKLGTGKELKTAIGNINENHVNSTIKAHNRNYIFNQTNLVTLNLLMYLDLKLDI